ncbi:hypothetical protein C8R43DRAFT_1143738 [Mycena crocata]|nr:hypothetical protein C8R43DRAFT_1143738 [Mycena crocata]
MQESRTTPSPMPLDTFTLPDRSPPISLGYDLRLVLANELDLMRHREKTESYYCGETTRRPDFLDHDPTSTSDTASDFTMAQSEADSEGYILGDAPVHAVPRPHWSSDFIEDFGVHGLSTASRTARTPSPPPPVHFKPLTHVYTRAELEHHGFEVIRDWKGVTPLTDSRGRCLGLLAEAPVQKRDWNRVVREATATIRHVSERADLDALPDHAHMNSPCSLRAGIDYYGYNATSVRPQKILHDSPVNQCELACLRGKGAFDNIAEWHNDLYRSYAPRIHSHVEHVKYRLLAEDCRLRDVYPGAFHAAEWF